MLFRDLKRNILKQSSLLLSLTASISMFTAVKTVKADDVTDLYFQQVIQRYFDKPQNARTFGMAGSSVLTSVDSSATWGNPAGLGFMRGGEFSGSYGYNRISGNEFPTGANIKETGGSGSTLLALPIVPTSDGLPQYGNFGVGWNAYNGNWQDDTFGTTSKRLQVTAAYAYAVTDALSLGYSFAWTEDHFQSRAIFDYPMHDGFNHTVGALWKFAPEWSWGSTVSIGHGEHHALYGPGIFEKSNTNEVSVATGVGYQFNQMLLLSLGADYSHFGTDGDVSSSIPANVVGGDENGNVFNVRVGAEYKTNDWLKLRGGYRYAGLASYKYNRTELNPLNGSANYSAFSLGAGLNWALPYHYVTAVLLDYGVEFRIVGDNDWQHLVTMTVPFNLCAP